MPAETLKPAHLNTALEGPRQRAIANLAPDVDGLIGKVLPSDTPGLQLLRNYAAAFDAADFAPSSGLSQIFVNHILDLVAMVLGANRDGGRQIAKRGMKAARLQAVKAYIVRNLADGALSIGAAAASQGLSRRQVQLLFEEDGDTFSAFVQQGRLNLVHTLLMDPAQGRKSISAVALDCGFSDVSHFNHAFRRNYGATPSDIRRQSRLGG